MLHYWDDGLYYRIYNMEKPLGDMLVVGWPSSRGVWALNGSDWEASERGWSIVYHAVDMEEKCKVIEKLGGTFYPNPEDCPHLQLT